MWAIINSLSKRSLLEQIKILTQRLDRNACDIPRNQPEGEKPAAAQQPN